MVKFSGLNGMFSVASESEISTYILKPSHVEGHCFKWLRKNVGIQWSNAGKLAVF